MPSTRLTTRIGSNLELSLEMIVSIGALFASVITSFVVTKTKVQDLDDHVKNNEKVSTLDSRLTKTIQPRIWWGKIRRD